MSGRRSTRARSKKKLKKSKKFLLASKKCWVIEEKLIPLYQHLVDDYSVQLREEWIVKVEETDVDILSERRTSRRLLGGTSTCLSQQLNKPIQGNNSTSIFGNHWVCFV